MARLTREDWKNPNSMMWIKVEELNIATRQKEAIKDVLKKLAMYEDQYETEEKLIKNYNQLEGISGEHSLVPFVVVINTK